MLNLRRLLEEFEFEVGSTNLMVGSTVVDKELSEKKQAEIALYNNLFAEEVGEIFEALDAEQTYAADVLMFDGVVDTLVVGSHLHRLLGGNVLYVTDFTQFGSKALIGHLDDDAFYAEATVGEGLKLSDYFQSVRELGEKAKSGTLLTIEEVRHVLWKVMNFFAVSNFCVADGHYRMLKEVTDSNWSKFPLVSEFSEAQAIEAVKAIEAQGRYKNVTFKKSYSPSGERYIFLAESGKYLKCPTTFKEPNIRQFIAG